LNDFEIGGLYGVAKDSVVAEYSLKYTGKPYIILSDSLAPEQYGIAFKKDNTELRDKVQKTLEEMAADGTVAKISEKWFGSDISIIGK
ncbi:MAG: transporter substrate-binding domain-containing protein, partial [Treponema sp.]|uniref:transporter substrate-binding domain-containing protein n=1 Tax=Treponema sp. TaxID=166 RepID=UPI002A9183BC